MKAEKVCEILNEALDTDASLLGLFMLGFHADIAVSETKIYCEMSTRPEACYVSVLGIVNAIIDDADDFLVTMSGGRFITMRN